MHVITLTNMLNFITSYNISEHLKNEIPVTASFKLNISLFLVFPLLFTLRLVYTAVMTLFTCVAFQIGEDTL